MVSWHDGNLLKEVKRALLLSGHRTKNIYKTIAFGKESVRTGDCFIYVFPYIFGTKMRGKKKWQKK